MAQAAQVIALLTAMLGELIKNELIAATGSAIVPGMLVEETAGGEVQEHSTAAVSAQKLFALPNIATGGTVDKVYAAEETASYGAAHSGQVVSALVATAAPAIVIGDALQSAGDGTLRKVVTSAATADTARDSTVGYAMEALTNVSGSNARLKVRVA